MNIVLCLSAQWQGKGFTNSTEGKNKELSKIDTFVWHIWNLHVIFWKEIRFLNSARRENRHQLSSFYLSHKPPAYLLLEKKLADIHCRMFMSPWSWKCWSNTFTLWFLGCLISMRKNSPFTRGHYAMFLSQPWSSANRLFDSIKGILYQEVFSIPGVLLTRVTSHRYLHAIWNKVTTK